MKSMRKVVAVALVGPGLLACAVARACAPPPVAEAALVVETALGRLSVDPARTSWSFAAAGRPVLADAGLELAAARDLLFPEGTRFVKFRMLQQGGDWDSYLGYLEFATPGQPRPEFTDSFTRQTGPPGPGRSDGLRWRTNVEGGLVCPQKQGIWGELVYPTAARRLRWVYQVVHADDVIEVHTSPDGQAWKLLARKTAEGGIAPRWRDEDAGILQEIRTSRLGPGRCSRDTVQDRLGPGQRIVYRGRSPEGLDLEVVWTLLDREPVLLLDARIINPGPRTLYPLTLAPLVGGHLLPGSPAPRCTVLGNDYWFNNRPIARMDRQADTTQWWATAATDRLTGRTAVLGVAEGANAGVRVRVVRHDQALMGTLNADLSPTAGARPLHLQGGKSLTLSRLAVLAADQVHDGLESYADLIVRQTGWSLRHPAYAGLFTGYSSSPDLASVVCLDWPRTRHLMDLVREKVGRFGPGTVKIEFEPMGSPNLLDPGRYQLEKYFPQGAQGLVRDIRARGLRPALQTRTFAFVRGGEADENRKTAEIYRRFTRDWGFAYLMLDFNEPDLVNEDFSRPRMQVFRDRFRAIREAVGPDVFIEACMIPYGPVIGLADGFRPSEDFRGGLEDQLLPNFAGRYYLHRRVFQLDTEFHDVARRPFLWGPRTLVTPVEGMRSWVSLCGLTGYSYLLGGAVEETSDERWRILSRAWPPGGGPARPVDLAENELPRVWSLNVRAASPRRHTIGLFNWDRTQRQEVAVPLVHCGLGGRQAWAAFDFWAQKYLGEVTDRVEADLPPRNCRVLWLTEIGDRPEIIGASRHLTGRLAGEVTRWDRAGATLEGTIQGCGDERVSLFVYVPPGWTVKSAVGAAYEQAEMNVVRLDVPTPKGEAGWKITFDPQAQVR